LKKKLSFLLALVLVLSVIIPFSTGYANSLEDEAGKILKEMSVLIGDGDNLMLNDNFKREQIVVLVSRLYGKEDEARNYSDINIPNRFKDLSGQDPNIKFYTPYIRWSVKEGLINGRSETEFGYGDNVTVQEFQTILLRALEYTIDGSNWNDVPKMAADLHLMDGLSLRSDAELTRGQVAVMTLNTLNQETRKSLLTLAEKLEIEIPKPFTVNATATVENNSVVITGKATGVKSLILHIKPASSNIAMSDKNLALELDEDGNFSQKVENLETGNYQYGFRSDTKNTPFEFFTIDVLPFALVDIQATNLKEIVLTFTQPVDKQIASMVNNYITNAGPVKDIRLEEDDKNVVLILSGNMAQQTKYKFSALKIKSASGEEIQLNDLEFEAFDSQIPKVLYVRQLGTKGLRIKFSEPVKEATTVNFRLNGKTFPGSTLFNYDTVTLTYISAAYSLDVGNHTLTVNDIQDFAGYSIINESVSFDIVKDTTPPTVTGATATLEKVIIEFSEEIDPKSAVTLNFYWMQGKNKRYSNKVSINENKATVEFVNNRLTTAENIIYVENIYDYSNNKIKATSVSVVPEIDYSPPEVINYSLSEDGKTITVYYSKNVYGNTRTNYSLVDSNNKTINIRDVSGVGNEFRVNLYNPLPIGLNTITIQDVKDTTPLQNKMDRAFVETINMKDVERPRIVDYTGYGNNIIITFNKPMDMGTAYNPLNYIMTYNNRQEPLPDYTIFTPGDDGKTINITIPEYHPRDGKRIMIGATGNLTSLNVSRLKDLNDNDLEPYSIDITFDGEASGKAKATDYYKERPGRQGVLVEPNLIKVKFSMPILQASSKDFSIPGRTISSVIADGTPIVSIYLNESDMTYLPNSSMSISSNNNILTSIDTGVEGGTILLIDEVPPRIKENISSLKTYGNIIELPFSEVLEEEGASLYRRDIEVIRIADNVVLNKDGYDYTTSLKSADKSILLITINRREIKSSYTVRLSGEQGRDTIYYIRDKDENLAFPDNETYFTEIDIPKQ